MLERPEYRRGGLMVWSRINTGGCIIRPNMGKDNKIAQTYADKVLKSNIGLYALIIENFFNA